MALARKSSLKRRISTYGRRSWRRVIARTEVVGVEGAVTTYTRVTPDDVPEIVEVRGKGLMLGVEFGKSDGSPDTELTMEVMEEAKKDGLLIGKGGLYGNTLRIAPPLNITEEQVDEGLEKLGNAIDRATSG